MRAHLDFRASAHVTTVLCCFFISVGILRFKTNNINLNKIFVILRTQGFSYFFCLVIEGSGSGSESIPLTDGSGSGSRRPKNMWIRWIRIRIRIRNTDCKKMYTIFLKIILSSAPCGWPLSLFWFRATHFFLHLAVDDLTMANPRCTAFRLI